jgi:hypothetical protein
MDTSKLTIHGSRFSDRLLGQAPRFWVVFDQNLISQVIKLPSVVFGKDHENFASDFLGVLV